MKEKILIYGAGGLGREILSLLRATDVFDVIGFLDDATERSSDIKGIKVVGGAEVLLGFDGPVNAVLAFGDPVTKAMKARIFDRRHIHFPSLVHPRAVLQDVTSITLGNGCVIGAGAILTTDIVVGEHTLVNINATVGHDTRVGRCTSIMPGVNVAGGVTIGNEVLIGSGASLINGVLIGDRATVGMGAVVTRDVDRGVVVVGVPAKPMMPGRSAGRATDETERA